MGYPVFPSIAGEFGIERQVKPQSRNMTLGDGYTYRVRFGLHPVEETYRITFNVLSADIATISNFLEARAYDGIPFRWDSPETCVDSLPPVDEWAEVDFLVELWKCKTWPITRDGPTYSTIEVMLNRQWSYVKEV